MQIEGLGGRKLAEEWRTGAEAYLGVTLSGYPNLFLLYGPNTNLGHNSIIFMIECQVSYVLQCIQQLMRPGLSYLDVRREAMDQYNEQRPARDREDRMGRGMPQLVQDGVGQGHEQLVRVYRRVLVEDARAGLWRLRARAPRLSGPRFHVSRIL